MADDPTPSLRTDPRGEETSAGWRQAYGVPEAILLGILTGVAYLAAFVYKASYARYFGVPVYLVRVGIETLIQTALVLGCFVLTVSESMVSFWFIRKEKGWISRITRLTWGVLAGFIIVIYIGYSDGRSLTIGLVVILAIMFVVELLIVFSHRIPPRQPHPPLARALDQVGPGFKFLAIAALIVVAASALFGEGAARRERVFLTFENGSQEYVVVSIFDEYVVAKDLHREEREFGYALRIVPLGSVPTGQFEVVGPLHRRMRTTASAPSARPPVVPSATPSGSTPK